MIGTMNGRPPQAPPGSRPPQQPRQRQGIPAAPPEVDLERLCTAIGAARKSLEYFRRERKEAVDQIAGMHYAEGGVSQPVMVNLLGMFMQIMSRSLVAKNPTVMLSTFDVAQKKSVSVMEGHVKDELEEMDFAGKMREVVSDGLVSIGILKVGIASPINAAESAWELEAGETYAEVIDLDDWVCDMYAKSFDQCSFMGHRYRVPVALANKMFQPKDPLTGEPISDTNADGDDRIGVIGRGNSSKEEFEEQVDLWEIYLPRHKLIVTLRDDAGMPSGKNPLKVQKWIGPPEGPYHILAYGDVPGNLMPKAPAMDLIDLHLAVNRSYRKLTRQTDRQKSVLPLRGALMDTDGQRVQQAADGEIVQADNADAAKEVTFGGPNQAVFLMAQHLKELFDFVGGNLSLLGGRAAQSRTATQDKMLNENASAGVVDLQETTVAFIRRVVKALCWYDWFHPQKVMETQWAPKSLPEQPMTRRSGPEDRKGPMPKVKVDPYSVAASTPQMRLQFINGVVQQVTPMLPLLKEQGINFNVSAYLDRVGRYGDEPDIADIFEFTSMPDAPQPARGGDGGGDETQKMPANTTRTYERRNFGGADSPGSKQNAVQNMLTSKNGMNGPVGS